MFIQIPNCGLYLKLSQELIPQVPLNTQPTIGFVVQLLRSSMPNEIPIFPSISKLKPLGMVRSEQTFPGLDVGQELLSFLLWKRKTPVCPTYCMTKDADDFFHFFPLPMYLGKQNGHKQSIKCIIVLYIELFLYSISTKTL